jgi:hypothetical protein
LNFFKDEDLRCEKKRRGGGKPDGKFFRQKISIRLRIHFITEVRLYEKRRIIKIGTPSLYPNLLIKEREPEKFANDPYKSRNFRKRGFPKVLVR